MEAVVLLVKFGGVFFTLFFTFSHALEAFERSVLLRLECADELPGILLR